MASHDPEHPAVRRRVLRRVQGGRSSTGLVRRVAPPDPAAGEHALLRLGLALAGALVAALTAVPLGILVRREWTPLVELDLWVTAAAERLVSGSPALLTAAQGVTRLGDAPVLALLGALLAAGLWWRGAHRLAVYVVVTGAGAMVLSQGLKHAVDRARPVFDEPVVVALGLSFPSGHALGAAAFWTSAAVVAMSFAPPRLGRPLLALALAVAAAVAATRVLIGVHFLSDVTAGLVLGLAWTALCTAIFAAWRREEGRPVDVLADGLDPGLHDDVTRPGGPR